MDAESVRTRLREAEHDPLCRAAREDLCRTLATAFRRAGLLLWNSGYLIGADRPEGRSPFGFGSDATVGLATVAQIAGELTAGAALALEHDNVYSAAALVRQLVEVEYLAWAFAEDREEAERWLRSTPEERLRMWQPRHLRRRAQGRFRGTDYARHCEHGGHPTPDARGLLPDHTPTLSPGLWWYDLASHGTSIWTYLIVAAAQRGWSAQIPDAKSVDAVAHAAARWRANDALVELTAELPSAPDDPRTASDLLNQLRADP